jgi:hypothetical protein
MLRFITSLVIAFFPVGSLASPLYARAGKEPAKKETSGAKKAPVDLNTASEDELKALPGSARPTRRRSSKTVPMPVKMNW